MHFFLVKKITLLSFHLNSLAFSLHHINIFDLIHSMRSLWFLLRGITHLLGNFRNMFDN